MPLIKSGSKAAVSKNVSEFHGNKTYNKTSAKFGKRKADLQAVAVALSNARKYARKAEGGEVSDSKLVKALEKVRDYLGGPPSAAGTIQSVLNAVPAVRAGLGPMRGMTPEQSLRFRQPDPQNGIPPPQQVRGQTVPLYSGRGQLQKQNTRQAVFDIGPYQVKEQPTGGWKVSDASGERISIHESRDEALAAARALAPTSDSGKAEGGFVGRGPGNEIKAQEGAPGFNRLYTTDRERFTRESPSPKPEIPETSRANARKYAAGGLTQAPWYEKSSARMMNRGSMIHSDVPGRTDQIPLKVKSGSFIVPADIVSGLGQGNSLAGTKEITKRIMNGGIRAPKMKGLKMSFKMPANPASKRMDFAEGGATPDVGIIAAGAEHVITPDEVRLIGHGDLENGHSYLDAWVVDERKKLIKTLRGLKPPKRD